MLRSSWDEIYGLLIMVTPSPPRSGLVIVSQKQGYQDSTLRNYHSRRSWLLRIKIDLDGEGNDKAKPCFTSNNMLCSFSEDTSIEDSKCLSGLPEPARAENSQQRPYLCRYLQVSM
jgi:hypothetical protein